MTESEKCNKRTCNHRKWDDIHCAEMSCDNYVNKCPEHGHGWREVINQARESQ